PASMRSVVECLRQHPPRCSIPPRPTFLLRAAPAVASSEARYLQEIANRERRHMRSVGVPHLSAPDRLGYACAPSRLLLPTKHVAYRPSDAIACDRSGA